MSIEDWEAYVLDTRVFFNDMIWSLDIIDHDQKMNLQKELQGMIDQSCNDNYKAMYLNEEFHGEYVGAYRRQMLHLLYNEVELWSDQEILRALQATIQVQYDDSLLSQSFVPLFDTIQMCIENNL